MTLTTLDKAVAADEIQEAMTRYLLGVDRLDAALIGSAFHADAVISHAGFTWAGGEIGTTVVAAISSMFDRSIHQLGNQLIEFADDCAYSESYVLAHCVLRIPDDDTMILRSLRYVDRFERRDGQWRIQNRQTIREWDRLERPVAPSQNHPHPASQRRENIKADFIAANGFWPAEHDGLLEFDADFLDAYLNLRNQAFASGALESKVREFIAIAAAASSERFQNAAIRNHIQQALRLGATRNEIVEVLKTVSLGGINVMADVLPLLRDELDAIEKESR
ncbi:nuclear transport factor 2 family protein [Mycolicibacterium goodii]|uniref:nuclear transport factor 2 family protein n=1 Tax=Mycolicibacterium goodii TaxID=134601 RepID=UPI001BDCD2DB|nr:nuclear transport factor 2 family protein [Mycolicibacterium goodii]MBU8808169.1 nuclear transport factor 2 family protein [Mycolicibacterium goodii]